MRFQQPEQFGNLASQVCSVVVVGGLPWNPLLSCWEVVKQGQGQPTKPDFMELMLLDDPARFFAFLSTSDAHEDICGKGRSRLGTGIGVALYHLFRHWHQFAQPRYGVQLNA